MPQVGRKHLAASKVSPHLADVVRQAKPSTSGQGLGQQEPVSWRGPELGWERPQWPVTEQGRGLKRRVPAPHGPLTVLTHACTLAHAHQTQAYASPARCTEPRRDGRPSCPELRVPGKERRSSAGGCAWWPGQPILPPSPLFSPKPPPPSLQPSPGRFQLWKERPHSGLPLPGPGHLLSPPAQAEAEPPAHTSV